MKQRAFVKKSFVMIMILVLIISWIPSSVFAEDNNKQTQEIEKDAEYFSKNYFESTTIYERSEFQEAYLKGFLTEELLKKDSLDDTLTEAEFYRFILNAEKVMGYEIGSNALTFDGVKYDIKLAAKNADESKVLTREAAANLFIDEFLYKELGRDFKTADHFRFPRPSVWEGAICTEMLDSITGSQHKIALFMLLNMDMVSGYVLMDVDEKGYFRFNDNITVKEVVQMVYRYSRCNIEYEDNYVAFDSEAASEVFELDDELLNHAKSIPMMTYDNIPEYNSINYTAITTGKTYALESDFKEMADLGINLIDFRVLYRELVSEDRKINIQTLETIDLAIEYAIKYGMHLRIMLFDDAGNEADRDYMEKGFEHLKNGKVADGTVTWGFGTDSYTKEEYREYVTSIYKVAANRYKNVPTNVISFHLFDEPLLFWEMEEMDPAFTEICYIIADAIWEVSPGRIVNTDCLQAGEYPSYALAEEGIRRNSESPRGFDQRIFQTMKFMGEWVTGFYGDGPSTANTDENELYIVPSEFVNSVEGAKYTINANSDGFSAGTNFKIYVNGTADKLILTSYDKDGKKLEELIPECNSTNCYGTFTLSKKASKVVLSRTDISVLVQFSYIWITYPETSDQKIPITSFNKAEDTKGLEYVSGSRYQYDEYNFDDTNAESIDQLANTFVVRFSNQKITYINCKGTMAAHGVTHGFKGNDSYQDMFPTTDCEITIKDGNDNRNYVASFKGDYNQDGNDETYSLSYAQIINQKMEKFKTFTEKYNTKVLNRECCNDFALIKEDYLKFYKDQFNALSQNGAQGGCLFLDGNGANSGLFNSKFYGGELIPYGKYYIDKDMLSLYESYQKKFTITDIDDQNYTGKALTPELAVSYKGTSLLNGTDYDVTYINNIEVGTACALVVGKGKYSGIFTTKMFLVSRLSESFNIKGRLSASIYADSEYTKLEEDLGYFGSFENVQEAITDKEGYLKIELNNSISFTMLPSAEKIKGVAVSSNILKSVNFDQDIEMNADLLLDGNITIATKGITIAGNGHKLILGSLSKYANVSGGTINASGVNTVIAGSVVINCDIKDLESLSMNDFEEGYTYSNEDEDPWSHQKYDFAELVIDKKISAKTLYEYIHNIFLQSGSALNVEEISGKYGNIYLQKNDENQLPELTVSKTMKNMDWQIRCYVYEKLDKSNYSATEVSTIPTGTAFANIPDTADESVVNKLGIMIEGISDWEHYGLKTLLDNRLYYDDGTTTIDHLWETDYTEDTSATCEKGGKKSIHCSVCDATKDVTEVPATGNHDFTNQPYQTDDAGKHYQICANCTAESEHVECTPDEAVKEAIVAPTCAKTGSHNDVVYCTVCNQKLSETYVEDAATGKHSYKNVVTKATLTTSGKIEAMCSVCGDISSTKIIYAAKTVKLDKTVYTYDGKTKKPSVIIKDSKGNVIPTSNYTVTYPTSSKKVGEYTVKVTFKGNYKGSKSLTFKINPVKTAISSLTAGSKSFSVKWAKKTAEVTGYQLQYSISDKFKTGNKTVTITKNGIVKKQIKNLKAGKKYFVRIRTYKTVGKVKFYSEWSASKAVTTKK